MCKLFSAVVTKDGRVFWSDKTMSHEEIKKEHGIKDTETAFFRENMTPIEIVPHDDDIFNHDLKNWKLGFDGNEPPSWWDGVIQDRCYEELEKCFEKIFFVDKKIDEISNQLVYLKNATVGKLVNVTGGEMWETSKVGEMCETSQVGEMRGTSLIESYSPDVKYKINDKGLAIIRYKDSIEIVHAKGNKVKLIKQKEGK